MRQREVGRLAALGLAALVFLPAASAGLTLLAAAGFLAEFLTGGRWPALSALTSPPRRSALAVAGVDADRYGRPAVRPGHALVLVHGLAADGKDDPRARWAADLLARAGLDVAVPTIPGLTRGRLRPDDTRFVTDTLAAMVRDRGAVRVLAVSLGAGPALLAAADPRVRDRVTTVLSLGGYASASHLLRFFLTGDHEFGAVRGHVDHERDVVRAFVAANGDLVDRETRERLAAGDDAFVAAFATRPPPVVRALLDALSPVRVAHEIRARLVLVHGRGDPAVPYTETLRLAAARPQRTTVIIVGTLGHVEATGVREAAGDLLALLGAVYVLLAPA